MKYLKHRSLVVAAQPEVRLRSDSLASLAFSCNLSLSCRASNTADALDSAAARVLAFKTGSLNSTHPIVSLFFSAFGELIMMNSRMLLSLGWVGASVIGLLTSTAP